MSKNSNFSCKRRVLIYKTSWLRILRFANESDEIRANLALAWITPDQPRCVKSHP